MSWLIPEWLLALALTLFVVDLFTDEEGIVSWIGVSAIAAWATWRIGAPPMWSVLVFGCSAVSLDSPCAASCRKTRPTRPSTP